MKLPDASLDRVLELLSLQSRYRALTSETNALRKKMLVLRQELRDNRAQARRVSRFLNPRLRLIERRQKPRLRGAA